MELFKLFGTIAIDNDEANNAIDNTISKADESGVRIPGAFKKIGAAVVAAFAVDKIVNFGKQLMTTTAEFEDSMLKTQSLMGASDADYERLKNSALDWGSKTAWSAKDVADAMGYMALAGWDTNEVLDATGGMLNLASASGEELSTVTDILTDSMTGFGDSAADASRYADVLATTQAKSNTSVAALGEAFQYVAPLAGAYGYKMEDVSTALGVMANAGVKGSMAGTSLSAVLTRLGTNTSGARDAIEELGVQFYNSDGTARNLSDVLKDMCDATANMTVEEKANFAATVAGQEAQKGLLAILNQGSDAYAELESQIKNSTGAAAEMAEKMESGVGGGIRQLKSALEGFSIALGSKFSEPVGNALRGVANVITGVLIPAIDVIANGFSKISGVLPYLIGLFAAFKAAMMIQGAVQSFQSAQVAVSLLSATMGRGNIAAAAFNGTMTLGQTIVALFTGKLKLAELATVAMAKGQALLNAVMTSNPIAIVIIAIAALVAAIIYLWNNSETFRNFWINLWETVKEKVSTAWESIKETFSQLSEWFNASVVEPMRAAFESFVETVSTVWETIGNAFQVGIEFVANILTLALEILLIPWMFIWENFGTVLIEAWETIKTTVSTAINALSVAIGEKFEAVKTTVSTVWDSVKMTAENAWNSITTSVSSKVNSMKTAVETAMNAMKTTVSNVWNAIKSAIETKIEEAKNKVSAAVSAIVGFLNFAGAVQAATAVFEGVRSAIDSKINSAKDKVSSTVSAIVGFLGFKGAVQTASSVFESIRSAIDEKINSARQAVSDAIERMKSYFNFSWSLPPLKLPHVSISGSFSLNPPSAPKFSISWYKRAYEGAAMFDNPTIVPTLAGLKGFGDGNGAEFVTGQKNLLNTVREGVQAETAGTSAKLDSLISILTQYLPEIVQNSNRQIVLDNGVLVGELSGAIDSQLGEMNRLRVRGL